MAEEHLKTSFATVGREQNYLVKHFDFKLGVNVTVMF